MTIDMTPHIEAKSNELCADDLIGSPKTITITKVTINDSDRPISIHYENGKPYNPSKSMRRVMVHVWGSKGENFVGQSMTLYRDPTVVYGGVAVGGIRISQMTGLKEDISIPLSLSRGKKTIHKVMRLIIEKPTPEKPLHELRAEIKACESEKELTELYVKNSNHSNKDKIIAACKVRKGEINTPKQEPEIETEAVPEYVKPEYDIETGEVIETD